MEKINITIRGEDLDEATYRALESAFDEVRSRPDVSYASISSGDEKGITASATMNNTVENGPLSIGLDGTTTNTSREYILEDND